MRLNCIYNQRALRILRNNSWFLLKNAYMAHYSFDFLFVMRRWNRFNSCFRLVQQLKTLCAPANKIPTAATKNNQAEQAQGQN
jgi:hypothetical protein